MNILFQSEEFTDADVLAQLESLEHQILVEDHGPSQKTGLVCTVSIARALSKEKPNTRALALQVVKRVSQGELCEERALDELLVIAESFLSRKNRGVPTWAQSSTSSAATNEESAAHFLVPSVRFPGCIYRTDEILARGSGGLVYAASSTSERGADIVLKALFASGKHEFEIAQKLAPGVPHCIEYIECIEHAGRTWFVLPRMRGDKTDLRQYILGLSSATPTPPPLELQKIVQQLLRGWAGISARGIVLRDVKPDNVLMDDKGNVFWADFGLAVDALNLHRAGEDLVQYWYDVCKLVPRPKWKARRPPERTYQFNAPLHSFDAYMLGIIFVCIATGIDFPHIDQKDMLARVVALLGEEALFGQGADYLNKFELGESIAKQRAIYLAEFTKTFGTSFGAKLLDVTQALLSRDPMMRPEPVECLKRLDIF